MMQGACFRKVLCGFLLDGFILTTDPRSLNLSKVVIYTNSPPYSAHVSGYRQGHFKGFYATKAILRLRSAVSMTQKPFTHRPSQIQNIRMN